MQMNEVGGKIDETDPNFNHWKREQDKHRRKHKEPRRIPFRLQDVFWPHEYDPVFFEQFEKTTKGENPFETVPMAILLEIKKGLDDGGLPSWFYQTLGVEKLREAIGQEAPRDD